MRVIKWFGWLLLVLLLFIAVVLGVLIAAPTPSLAWVLKTTADMDFEAADSSLGLFPLRLQLSDATISGIGNTQTLVDLREGDLTFDWWGYLQGEPVFWSLEGEDVNVHLQALETADSAAASASESASATEADGAAPLDLSLPLGFARVVVNNLAIDSGAGDTQTLSVNLERPDNAADLVNLALTLQSAGGPFATEGQLRHGRAGPIDIDLHLPTLDLSPLMAATDEAASEEAAEPLDLAGLLATAARFNLRIDRLIAPPRTLTDVVLAGSMGEGQLRITELALHDPQADAILAQYLPLKLKANVTAAGERVSVSDLAATFGASDLAGSLSLHGTDPLGAPERIEGALTAQTLSFVLPEGETIEQTDETADSGEEAPKETTEEMTDEKTEEKTEEATETTANTRNDAVAAPETGATEEQSEPAAGTRLFSDEPLPLEFLQQLAADLELNAAKLQLLDAEFTDFALKLRNDETALHLEPSAVFGDGGFDGTLTVRPTDDQAAVDLLFKIRDVNLEAFGLVPTEELQGGKTNLDMKLTGAGASSAALAGSLNGEILLRVTEAVVQNDTFELAGSDLIMELLSKLNPFAKEDPTTKLSCALVKFEAVDGVLVSRNQLVVETEKMEIVGNGKIDLGKETLDIGITPNAKSGVGLNVGSLVKFLKLGGTLSDPRPQASAGGLLKSGAAIGAAASTGGLSILAEGLVKRVANAGNACERALKQSEKDAAEAEATATQDSGETPTSAAADDPGCMKLFQFHFLISV